MTTGDELRWRGTKYGWVAGIMLGYAALLVSTSSFSDEGIRSGQDALRELGLIILPFLGFLLGFGAVQLFYNSLADEQDERRRIAHEVATRERDATLRANEAIAAEKRRLEAEAALRSELSSLSRDSLQARDELLKLVVETDAHIDEAKRQFAESAFDPFWDAIERAVTALSEFDATARRIGRNALAYREKAALLRAELAPFPLDSSSLPNANVQAARLREVVRVAQKDFQFTVIFQQRRTNSLLIHGFGSLGEALRDIDDRLAEGFEGISGELSAVAEVLAVAGRERTQAVTAAVRELGEQAELEAEAQAERDKRALEMLDNLQRRRLPER